jgi:4-hydroxy-2-oxoheptanedioate aldolase
MNKKFLIGTFTLNTCPNVTEIISKNMDYVIIDREHGPHDFNNANILNKIIKKNCLSLIRVSHLNRIEIQKCLELDPDGILIPQISSYSDAKKALSYSFFSPKGTRGLSPYTCGFDYNHHNSDNKKKIINKKIFLGLLIEGVEGLAALNKICSDFNKEISLIYFGLYDFTSSLGLKPDWKDSRVKKAVKKIVDVCKKKNIKVGSIARDLKEISFLKKMGINFICYQNDTGIIHEAFSQIQNKR